MDLEQFLLNLLEMIVKAVILKKKTKTLRVSTIWGQGFLNFQT